MDTFPYHAMSRPYAGDSPHWRPTDGGIASLMLGSGILRTRAELGQAIWAVDLQFQGLTQADASTLWSFYLANRAATFYWSDPKTSPFAASAFATYECRFDPATPPDIAPSSQLLDRYDAAMTLLPVVPTVAEEMLVAHWKMNDNAATTDVVDATGNGHTGTASANTDTMTVAGKIGTALTFNGTSDVVTVPDHDDLDMGTGDFSLLAWVKTSSTVADQRILSKRSPSIGYDFYITVAGSLGLFIGDASGYTVQTVTPAASISDGAWHLVGVTVSRSGNSYFYIDGVPSSARDFTSRPATLATSAPLLIGRYSSSYFNGVLDDVRIYKRPLSAQEIRAIYNSGSGTEEVIVP